MKANAMTSTSTDQNQAVKRQSHAGTFAKVLDGRKQPIRGLWIRNGRYYAQLTIEDSKTGNKSVRRIPLLNKDDQQPCGSVPQAVAAFERLKVNRTDDKLPVLVRTPKFPAFADKYLDTIKSGVGTKKPGTIQKEKSHI